MRSYRLQFSQAESEFIMAIDAWFDFTELWALMEDRWMPRPRNVNPPLLQHVNVGRKCGGIPTLGQLSAATFLPSGLLVLQPSFAL
jgi:hypothetical protein